VEELARDVALVTMTIANAYLVGKAEGWVLVDSGTPGNAGKIKEAAEARFGPGAKPRAILLTHGHFDHAGSAPDLASEWGMNVYTHRLEWPYLTGESYPPHDPTAPGFFSFLVRFFPARTVNLGRERLREIGSNLSSLGLAEWETQFTPGHTPGHVALYRKSDGTLLAGDAVTTMNVDNFFDIVTKRQQVCRPPAPATTDWERARRSVQLLASLRPRVIAAGHGTPMTGAADELQHLADHFPVPEHGRYVAEPARADESGVTYLPPAPVDAVPKIAAGVAVAAILAGVGAWALKTKKERF
jgi:glyoxylase-like metal-dependent hydrolase (beta-lactamase superfamily II)